MGNVDISLRARNEASSAIKQVQADLGGLDSTASKLAGGLGAIGSLAGAAGVAGFIALGTAAAKTAYDMAVASGAAQEVEDAYRSMAATAGVSADNMLASMHRASAGTIADVDLMIAANRAMAFGLTATADQMGALMALAKQRSEAFGTSTEEAFSSLVEGIGRNAPRALQAVGISIAQARKAQDDYAASMGTTADKLNAVQQQQALLNAAVKLGNIAMADAAGTQGSAADAADRLAASWKNLMTAAGKAFGPGATTLANTASGWIDAFNQGEEDAKKQLPILLAQDALKKANSDLQGEINKRTELFKNLSDYTANSEKEIASIQDAFRFDPVGQENALNAYLGQLTSMQQELITTGNRIEEFKHKAASAQTVYDALTAPKSLFAGDESNKPWTWQTGKAKGGTDAAASLLGVSDDEVQKLVDSTKTKIAGMAQELYKAMGGGAAGQEQSLTLYQQQLTAVEALIKGWVAMGKPIDEITHVLLPEYLSTLDQSVGKYIAQQSAATQLRNTLYNIPWIIGQANAAAGSLAGTLSRAAGSLIGVLAGVAQANNSWVMGQALALAPTMGADKALAYAQEQGKTALQAGVSALGNAQPGFEQYGLLVKQNELADANQKMIQLATSTAGAGSAAKEAKNEYSDLASKVQGIIQGAYGDTGGADPNSVLPRQESVAENARRLGDIMNKGFAGQDWIDKFKNEVPGIFDELTKSGNVKEKAAEILRQFQEGLRPELIDKEAVKERVKTMILGERNTAALAQEIAGELSKELGVSLGEAQSMTNQALGIGGPQAQFAAGAAAGTGDAGASMVQGLIGTLKLESNLTLIYQAGKDYGGKWGEGFLLQVQQSVPMALITILAKLVTPQVQQALQQQGSRSGAQ